ncbi:hypothetical protein BKA64DRAFT_46269 [Cadophora sp. MPI-SDFR-AT-0126]|nr:hypothetical protein BKA64DRAFT_46269 [Leotiomycetes sp. MPI-SDFR-AT-0126]
MPYRSSIHCTLALLGIAVNITRSSRHLCCILAITRTDQNPLYTISTPIHPTPPSPLCSALLTASSITYYLQPAFLSFAFHFRTTKKKGNKTKESHPLIHQLVFFFLLFLLIKTRPDFSIIPDTPQHRVRTSSQPSTNIHTLNSTSTHYLPS